MRPIRIPRGAVAVQAGEAGAILSRGALAAAPHCVLRPAGGGGGAARAQFVVFTQPAWGAPLGEAGEAPGAVLAAAAAAAEGVAGATPPLAGRWEPGIAYGEFARRTAAAYYGADARRGARRA